MNEFMTESFAEMNITKWGGAKMKVSIQLPGMAQTATSQIIFDELQMEDMQGLAEPEEISFLTGTDRELALNRWEQRRHRAQYTIDAIAGKIAREMGVHFSKQFR